MVLLFFQKKAEALLANSVWFSRFSAMHLLCLNIRLGLWLLSLCAFWGRPRRHPGHSRALLMASLHPFRKKQEPTGGKAKLWQNDVCGTIEMSCWLLGHLKIFANLVSQFHSSRLHLFMSETNTPSPLRYICSSYFAVLEETQIGISLYFERCF